MFEVNAGKHTCNPYRWSVNDLRNRNLITSNSALCCDTGMPVCVVFLKKLTMLAAIW